MRRPAPAVAAPSSDTNGTHGEFDVRDVPKARRHPLVFERFNALAVGDSFVLVNAHDPKHLHEEFQRDHPGAYDWEYLARGERDEPTRHDRRWRIRITRRTDTDLPRLVGDTHVLLSAFEPDSGAGGAVWRLDSAQRHLDANVIRIRPDGEIVAHLGPDLDVLMHVIHGSGHITTAVASIPISAGALVWLPRRSQRAVHAGSDGLVYLSVHPRRPGLSITAAGEHE